MNLVFLDFEADIQNSIKGGVSAKQTETLAAVISRKCIVIGIWIEWSILLTISM